MSYFDDNEDRIIYGRGRRDRYDHEDRQGGHKERDPRCNRCGSTDVRWRQQGGRWVLFSLQPGKEHVCPVKDEFDALD